MIFETDTFETPFDLPANVDVKSCSLDVILALYQRVNTQFDSLIKDVVQQYYHMSARIGIEPPGYQMDTIIVIDPNDPRFNESFINTFLWSYANQYNNIDIEIQMMIHRLKLDFANSDDLDEYWGQVLGVRRWANESDNDYRTRLATHIRIITSSGTKYNIQTVIDRITGYPNGSIVTTYWPATIRLSWSAPNVTKAAYANQTLISNAMDRAVAAGVSWSTAYPFEDYRMDFMKCYNELFNYTFDAAISRKRGYVYHMITGFWETKLANDGGIESYQIGSYLGGAKTITYEMMSRALGSGSGSYQVDAFVYHMYPFYRTVTYEASGGITTEKRRSYNMLVSFPEKGLAEYSMDTIIIEGP